MKIPERLKPLLEDVLIDDVTRQLMNGKKAVLAAYGKLWKC